MDDRAEIHGSEGVAYADVLRRNSIQTYSQKGVEYEKIKRDRQSDLLLD